MPTNASKQVPVYEADHERRRVSQTHVLATPPDQEADLRSQSGAAGSSQMALGKHWKTPGQVTTLLKKRRDISLVFNNLGGGEGGALGCGALGGVGGFGPGCG